jgi:pimeloyl-ACP methyl ester carboxylesterase
MTDVPRTATPRPIVLVHGAWHGAWCWAALQAELDRRGISSYAIDLPGHGASILPLGDLHGDAMLVSEVIDRLGTEVVLVGHSYGGAVITQAATRTDFVNHLVYLTAFVLDEGESLMGLLGSMPHAGVALSAAMRQLDDSATVLDPEAAVPALYGHCAPEVAAAAVQRLSPQPVATFLQAATGAPWRHLPSTYVRCTQDQAIHISHQDLMSQRCSFVATLETDHSPFASAVLETADILEPIARR